MQLKLSGLALALCLGSSGLAVSGSFSAAWAQPKSAKKGTVEVGSDKTIEKQSAWEQQVMGEDAAKKNDLKKIAAAQKAAEEARKNPPPPEPAKKHKDPSKEGARAKAEASIGLPIESEEAEKSQTKKPLAAKKVEPSNSADDELGALVAASLASDKKEAATLPSSSHASNASGKGRAAKGKTTTAKAGSGSSLDKIFAN
ncbi:MAG TPA: hypothetical protein VIU64_09210 [Polyangia bacterium]